MKIQWNTVTWYSKLCAAIFFIFVIPALAFYIGMQYQSVKLLTALAPSVEKTKTKPELLDLPNTVGAESFRYKDALLTYEKGIDGSLNTLDIVYNKGGDKETLIQVPVDDTYDFKKRKIFFRTNNPSIALVKNVSSVGKFEVENYYVDMNTRLYAILQYSSDDAVNIKDFDDNTFTISLEIDGSCEEGSNGPKKFSAIYVDDDIKHTFNPPIEKTCAEYLGVDSILTPLGLSSDLKKVFFRVDKEEFTLDLKSGKIK